MTSMDIISRAEWGARYAGGDAPAPLPAREVWLHHSVTPEPHVSGPLEEEYAAARQLEQIGQDRFGAGVSYTFLVMPSGHVLEGHGIARRGTHTGGRNSTSRGICWVGNYQEIQPTNAMVAATVELLRHGHAAGWWLQPELAGGHRDVKATACPGNRAYALIPEINRRAAGALMSTSPASPPPPSIVRELLGTKLPDLYREGLPPMTLDAVLAWGCAHAAHARDAADAAASTAGRVEGIVRDLAARPGPADAEALFASSAGALGRIEQKLDSLLAGGADPGELAENLLERAAQLLVERLAPPTP